MDRRSLLQSLLVAPFAFLFPKPAAAEPERILRSSVRTRVSEFPPLVSQGQTVESYKMASISMRVEPGDLPKSRPFGTECPFVVKLREAMLAVGGTPALEDHCSVDMSFYGKNGKWGLPVTIKPVHLFRDGRWNMLRLGVALAGRERRPWLDTADIDTVLLTFFFA